jgi:lysine 6-dehydrogenase
MDGMLDYYTTRSRVLRDGVNVEVDALSELEEVEFASPPGTLEAFHTAGGLSTMAGRYERQIKTMEYKTLRYPGHAHLFRAIRELGLLDSEPLQVNGVSVSPRSVFAAAAEPRLRKEDSPDIVVLRVVVEGKKGGDRWRVTHELIDERDDANGISAMMRTTGYSLSITALMQARGVITQPGVHTPDECVPAEIYLSELGSRGIAVKTTSVHV